MGGASGCQPTFLCWASMGCKSSTAKDAAVSVEPTAVNESSTVPEVAPEARQTEAHGERDSEPSTEEQQLITPEFQIKPVEARAGSTAGMFGCCSGSCS